MKPIVLTQEEAHEVGAVQDAKMAAKKVYTTAAEIYETRYFELEERTRKYWENLYKSYGLDRDKKYACNYSVTRRTWSLEEEPTDETE